MSPADVQRPRVVHLDALRYQLGFWGLFGALCAFTLTTWDGGQIAPRLISVFLFLLASFSLAVPVEQRLTPTVPLVCLLAMTVYGVLQTLFFPQKILSDGWAGVLFWFTSSILVCLSVQVFLQPRSAARFRRLFVIFGTAVCLLDLLQQASRTNQYFWLIPSRYHAVFGPFAYWNNFAQFVELLLPVTLWKGLGSPKPLVPYILCAALQIGSVVASGSRAGTALVTLELCAMIVLAFARHRNKALVLGGALAVLLSVLFIYAAGFDALIAKVEQNDQLSVRRNIDRSSFAMVRARPLAGWGLDTYVSVYRMFALYDDGTFVNRAHNDWLQWAAEGGVFFSGAMLVVFIWSIRPAIRSGWGIGLIAVCLHALVDYPFARFGICGWYFCLLGMLAALQKLPTERHTVTYREVNAAFRLRPASGRS